MRSRWLFLRESYSDGVRNVVYRLARKIIHALAGEHPRFAVGSVAVPEVDSLRPVRREGVLQLLSHHVLGMGATDSAGNCSVHGGRKAHLVTLRHHLLLWAALNFQARFELDLLLKDNPAIVVEVDRLDPIRPRNILHLGLTSTENVT